MSERRRQRPARVALCAALTWDGKLDPRDPLPPALRDTLRITGGDRLVADAAGAADVAVIPSAARRQPAAAVRALRADPHVRRILCLGGPRLFRALLDAGLVNDLHLLLRPRVDARRGAPTLSGPPTAEFFPRSIACRLRRMEVVGGECLLHYTIPRPAA